MDCHSLAADFDAFAARVDENRALRARAYGNTPSGRRCLAAGLLVRAVLGGDCGIAPDAFGKPRLPDGRHCNLSHAGDYAVLATASADVGVDIERIRPLDSLRIAERFFHPDEYAYLLSLPDPYPAFFTIWTLKESYVKALGKGFAIAPTAYRILPEGENGATLGICSPFHFRRYDERFPGYRLSVCAMDPVFPNTVRLLYAGDIR